MDVLLRESSFGRILNYVSNNQLFPPPILKAPKSEWTASSSSSFTFPDAARQIVVDFTGFDDPDMPRNWPALAKFVAMIDIMLLNFSFYAASALFTPSIPKIKEEFGATAAEGTLGLSLFVIAYGIGPLIVRIHYYEITVNILLITNLFQLSPLSNLPSIGRTPVYVVGTLAFCLFNIGTAVAKNLHTILILRFFGGLVGSAPISVGGASLVEIFKPSQVPYVIALYAASGVCGPILGPVCRLFERTIQRTLTKLNTMLDPWNPGSVCVPYSDTPGMR